MIVRTGGTVEQAECVGFDAARALVLRYTQPLPSEIVTLGQAHGRIVASTLFADDDLLAFERAATDGYALRAADTVRGGAGVVLGLAGSARAADGEFRLPPGQAVTIMSGAPLPRGADAVVPFEGVVEREGRGEIMLRGEVVRGSGIFGCGADAKRGDALIRRGEELTPGRAALLGAAGQAAFAVLRRPRVAIVCSGDELVGVDERPPNGRVRNSNAAMLGGHLARDGAELVSCVRTPDDERVLKQVLREALSTSDLVITTGGAAVDDRDVVKRTLGELGVQFAFRSVALRPAKAAAFGSRRATLVAALPGHPAAAFIAYSLLVRGIVRRLAGVREAFPDPIGARLVSPVGCASERHYAAFAQLAHGRGGFSVTPLGHQRAALVRTSAEANALIVLPPGEAPALPGDVVGVEVPDWNAITFA